MDRNELNLRFSYHPPKDGQPAKYTVLRDAAKTFAGMISDLVPESREQALAIAAVEEAVMWANAGIARSGAREAQPERGIQVSPDPTTERLIGAITDAVVKRINEIGVREGLVTAGV